MTTVRVYGDDCELLWEDEYNSDTWCWGTRAGHTGEMCGGCVGCMVLQAYHSNLKVEFTETVEPTLFRFDVLRDIDDSP